MLSASPWSPVLVGVCLLAIVALAAMIWTLAPFFREILRSGTVRQKRAVGGLILLTAVESGAFIWMVAGF